MGNRNAMSTDDADESLTLRDTPTERGTRIMFGKPYHWGRNEAGNLVLLHGPDPRQMPDHPFGAP